VTENPVAASEALISGRAVMSPRRLILPLALAQFICSFAGSNINVMITDISEDLDTTVKGVQTTITLFLLTMAILMIPCSKLTDRWGRKRCFMAGLTLYGIGALLSALSPGLGVLILDNSVLEGVGTALLILWGSFIQIPPLSCVNLWVAWHRSYSGRRDGRGDAAQLRREKRRALPFLPR
jgi:MFS family permease